jgi:hypothetical protein
MSKLEDGLDPGNGGKPQDEAGHKPAPKITPKPKPKSKTQKWIEQRVDATWKNLLTNHLWQRMLKNTLATTITVIIALIPAVVAKYGNATYLAPIATVFGHPGRRFGQMAEALILTLLGTLIGAAWSTFGIYLSSLVYGTNEPAAYTIKGLFLVVVVLSHGFLRSHTPRLFIMVLLMIIVSVVSLTGETVAVSSTLIKTLLYPILTAAGILLIVNICIFPEFSSSFLGITTIETLGETIGALRDAGKYFIHSDVPPEVRLKPEVEEEFSNAEAPTAAKEPADDNAFKPSSVLTKTLARIGLKRGDKKDTKLPKAKAPKVIKLKSLTDEKSNLRKKLNSCKDAQDECNFELAFAVLPPRDLKLISDTAMKKLVANTIALIGVCESKYALTGDQGDSDGDEKKDKGKETIPTGDAKTSRKESLANESSADEKEKEEDEDDKLEDRKKEKKGKARLERQIADLELVKPHKEIEFGDIKLLRLLVERVSRPVRDLQEKIDRSVDVISSCLAYCYDVPKLPDGSRPPKGIKLEEIDIWADTLTSAIAEFDRDSESALEGATSIQNLNGPQIDIMPRVETFLISSFILNLRQAAIHTHQMLTHSRKLVEKRQARHDRRRVYAPKLQWRKWLTSGGEQDMMALPSKGRKDARTGTLKESSEGDANTTNNSEVNLLKEPKDEEAATNRNDTPSTKPATKSKPPTKTAKYKGTITHRLRNHLADAVECALSSEDVLYSLKLTVAVFLVTWPAFLSAWNYWYYVNRGLWAALQLVLVTEVAIGNSIFIFILRAVGTTLGCLWGWAAYEVRGGNRIVCVIILVIGIIPSTYVQLGTKYIKAGMVAIVSMCVVALATEDQTATGTATGNFLKRWIAFLIGGTVALIVEFILFPVKARDRLVESLAASICHISDMEACVAYGIETETNVDVHSPETTERFESAKAKAQSALTAAETFLPFCSQEPRLKGSFAGLALVYTEILYVLHQIVDKMDNMLQLRTEYGSSVLEELNVQVYPYRRNLAGSVTLILFAVHEALTTKLPLPQFLPSARLAHLRMINRVRDIVLNNDEEPIKSPGLRVDFLRSQIDLSLGKRIVQRKFLSWNAASGGQTEVIEYLEELIDLTKLLVGANEFRSGMLMRPTFRDYVERIGQNPEEHIAGLDKRMQKGGTETDSVTQREQAELRDTMPELRKVDSVRKRTMKKIGDQAGKASGMKKVESADEADRRKKAEEEELPRSLQRVRTRRVEERMERLERITTREREAQQRARRD